MSFQHEGVGVGVYGFFRDHACVVSTAVVYPEDTAEGEEKAGTANAVISAESNDTGVIGSKPTRSKDIRFQNAFTRHLNGKGTIASVLNGHYGGAVGHGERSMLMQVPLATTTGAYV